MKFSLRSTMMLVPIAGFAIWILYSFFVRESSNKEQLQTRFASRIASLSVNRGVYTLGLTNGEEYEFFLLPNVTLPHDRIEFSKNVNVGDSVFKNANADSVVAVVNDTKIGWKIYLP